VPATINACRNERKIVSQMTYSQYDLWTLEKRIRLWHDEADRAASEAIRQICIAEACECERRLQRSVSTPVLSEIVHLDRWKS
jgi:hypothetical protein